MMGFEKSSSLKPVARSIERPGARCKPSVTAVLLRVSLIGIPHMLRRLKHDTTVMWKIKLALCDSVFKDGTEESSMEMPENLWAADDQTARLAEMTGEADELKAAPLRRDVRSLGRLLGEVLKEQVGQTLFDRVEHL